MNHLNKTTIQGNLVRDTEFKDLGQSQLCKFTLASSRKFKDKESTCFIEVITWGKLAEVCHKYLLKGKPVLVDGRLELDTWVNKDGEKRSKHTIIANEVIFLPHSCVPTKDRIIDTQSRPITVEDVKCVIDTRVDHTSVDDLPF